MSKIKMDGDCDIRSSSNESTVELIVENKPLGPKFSQPRFRLQPVNDEAVLFLNGGLSGELRNRKIIPDGHQGSLRVPFQLKIFL